MYELLLLSFCYLYHDILNELISYNFFIILYIDIIYCKKSVFDNPC